MAEKQENSSDGATPTKSDALTDSYTPPVLHPQRLKKSSNATPYTDDLDAFKQAHQYSIAGGNLTYTYFHEILDGHCDCTQETQCAKQGLLS